MAIAGGRGHGNDDRAQHADHEANPADAGGRDVLDRGPESCNECRKGVPPDDKEAEKYGAPPGTFTEWEPIVAGSNMLFYEGLHGAIVTEDLNVAQHADLKIGVVPVINLEWIQKIHRDKASRGYSTEAVTDTILRRMPDYVRYICPQFTETDVNFQRVPTVDTSNPFIARWIPTPDESLVVIRFANPRGIDFSYLVSMIHDSFMSRANSIVIPGNKMDLAMQLILTPMILKLVERRRRAA